MFARVVGAVVLRTFATDILQGTNGRDFGQVFIIYHFGVGRVNNIVVGLFVVIIVIIIVVRRRFRRRINRFVAVVVITATASGNAYCYQDSEREICQFHTGCTFLNLS